APAAGAVPATEDSPIPSPAGRSSGWNAADGLLIRGAPVVTMDDTHTVVPDGRVLVRDGRIVAFWNGPIAPVGITIGNPTVLEADPDDLLFPGFINLHDHPTEDLLPVALPPASDAIPAQGKTGRDPYANRYQWRDAGTIPPEFQRLINNAADVLSAPSGLGLETEMLK